MNFIPLRTWGRALALAVCFFHAAAFGKPVGADQAAAAVRGWLKVDRTPVGEGLSSQVKRVDTVTDGDGVALYHVVNLDPAGFVIVAGDDRIEPVIAFSKSGSFVRTSGNPLSDLADQDLAERAAHVQAVKALRASAASAKWQRLTSGAGGLVGPLLTNPPDVRVAPFVKSHWGQDVAGGLACFNYFTPKGPAGNSFNYPCGCVATAMAQIMRYYQYPTVQVGTPQFEISVDDAVTTARLRGGNGAGGAYAWASMPLDVDPNTPTLAQRQAIGALCRDVGVAAQMQYLPASAGGSGAYLDNASAAFKSPFRYANSVYAFNLQGIDSLVGVINPNLDARIPVLVGIYSASSGGHAVVCDGYGYSASTVYHHLNLGWTGQDDAWYALPSIDTSGGDWTSVTDLVYNLMTSGTGEIISGRVLETTGLPVANVTVSAQAASGGITSALTDTNGIYALVGVASDSQFAISLKKDGFFPTNGNCFTSESIDGAGVSGDVWGVNFTLTRMGAPVFVSEPVAQVVGEGAVATLTALAGGQSPIALAWYRNGVLIPGATNSSYVLENVQVASSGDTFYCVASNALGSATSDVATLTVNPTLVDHFTLGTIGSPQTAENPFTVSITAVSSMGATVSNFNASVTLSATAWAGSNIFAEGFESGSSAWSNEGGTYTKTFSDSAAVGAKSLSLSGGDGAGSYDGLQHKFATPCQPDRISFYICGTETNKAGGYVVAGSAKYRTNGVFHFHLHTDGTMGLYDGAVQWHGVPYQAGQWYKIGLELNWTARTLDYYVNDTLSAAGVSFCSSNAMSIAVVNLFNVDGTTALWDEIEFAATTGTTPVAISPTTVSGFVGGVWTGQVTLPGGATNVVIHADDGQSHVGSSGAFMLLPAVSALPTITVQPQDQRVAPGGTATFSIGVAGAPPMTFTWTRNGQPVPGASGTNCTLENVSLADSGTHFGCIVANSAGSVASVAVRLLVTPTNHVHVAVIGTDTTDRTGDVKAKLVDTGLFDDADVDVYCVFYPPQPDLKLLRRYAAVLVYSYTQFPDATAFGNTLADYVDAGGSVVLASSALDSEQGYGVAGRMLTGGYLPYVPGVYEPDASGPPMPYMSLVPVISDHPILDRVISLDNGIDGWRNHISAASGATLVAQWSTGQPLVLVKEINSNRVAALNLYPPSSDVETGAWNSATDGGMLMANALRWVSYEGSRMPPFILQQPRDAFAPPSGVVTLGVLCSGAQPLSYQWFKDGQPLFEGASLTGTISPNLVLNGLAAMDAGKYSVVVSNSFGAVTSSLAVVTVMVQPVIDLQPVDTTVAVGGTVALKSHVVDNGPVSYQWFKGANKVVDGAIVSGANSPTLTFVGVRISDAGSYTVVASNLFGSAVSQPAALTVVSAPLVQSQPASRTNGLGSAAQFHVVAQGGGLSYQWKHGSVALFDGGGILGAQSDTLTISSVAAADAGDYSVTVSNQVGTSQSRVAKLTVILPPCVTIQPGDQVSGLGSNVTLQVTATGTQPLGYRWFKNGAAINDVAGKISGSRSSNLVIRAIGATDPGTYFVVVSNFAGTAACSNVKLRVGPTVAVTSPAAKAVVTSNAVTVTGTARDAGGSGVAQILWQVNGQGFQSAAGLSNWNAKPVLIPGTNTFAVKSVDVDGLESLLASRSVVYNPFAALAGSYNGLFFEADSARPGRAGMISLALAGAGSFSGKLYVGATASSFAGKFDYSGAARVAVAGVQIDLSLDVEEGSGALTGQVAGQGWVASLSALRGVPATKGTYTLGFDNPDLAALGLPGDGFATATVSASGSVVLAGRLADDTVLNGVSAVAGTNGVWPLYSSVYGGKGMVLGWLSARQGTAGGSAIWAKPAGTNALNGFTNKIAVAGSSLPAGTRLMSWTNGVAIWGGATLTAPMTNRVVWSAKNAITVAAGQTNGLALSVNTVNGQVTGSFVHPVTRQKVAIKAIILDQQNEARGYFVAPQPGWFLLREQP